MLTIPPMPRCRRRRRVTAALGVAVGLLFLAGWAVIGHAQTAPSQAGRMPSQAQGPAPTRSAPNPSATAVPSAASKAEAEIAQLRTAPAVSPASAGGRISGETATQPDLYAAEFVRRLLTQDYQKPRARHLAWVQSEAASTNEPLVVGLVPPELRDRLAVFSVTTRDDSTAPIPTAAEWDALGRQHGFTTVTIERVTEPLAWTNAVASGRITDPGIAGREVAATTTRHTRDARGDHTTKFSVAMRLNLEGPPTRDAWGFVTAVTYTAIPLTTP